MGEVVFGSAHYAVLFFIEQGWLDAGWAEAQRFVNTTGPAVGAAVNDIQFLAAQKRAALISEADRGKVSELERLLCGFRYGHWLQPS